MARAECAGYQGTGPNTGQFVPAEEALDYALAQCGVTSVVVNEDAPLAEEFLSMVEDWVFDSGWRFVEEGEELL